MKQVKQKTTNQQALHRQQIGANGAVGQLTFPPREGRDVNDGERARRVYLIHLHGQPVAQLRLGVLTRELLPVRHGQALARSVVVHLKVQIAKL